MKYKIVILAFATITVQFSCQNQKKKVMDTKTYSNAETVRKMYEAMSKKDIKTWISFWTKDGIQYLPYAPDGFPESIAGRDNLEQIYTDLLAGYGELRYTHIDIDAMANPDKVLARWGVDIELKGKTERYKNELIGIFEFEDGKVKSFTEYFNPLAFNKAIGK
jgi:uncharacterized protein